MTFLPHSEPAGAPTSMRFVMKVPDAGACVLFTITASSALGPESWLATMAPARSRKEVSFARMHPNHACESTHLYSIDLRRNQSLRANINID